MTKQEIILNIIMQAHAKACEEVAQIARDNGKTYDEVADLYDRIRDERKTTIKRENNDGPYYDDYNNDEVEE